MRAVHYAAIGGHFEVVRVLLKFGADIDAHNEDWFSALHLAAMTGHHDVAHLLLDSGATTEADDLRQKTPLHHAALGGHVAVVRLLLDSGASMEAEDREGQRPLGSHERQSGSCESPSGLWCGEGGENQFWPDAIAACGSQRSCCSG